MPSRQSRIWSLRESIVSVRSEIRSANERAGGAFVELRLSLRSVYFRLEGESQAEIGLDKVFQR